MEINYELAKELKEAGFPSPEPLEKKFLSDEFKGDIVFGTEDDEPVYLPTLSELIEACGEGLKELVRHERYWEALAIDPVDGIPIGYYRGLTPEEAVARLWLALNKK